MFNLFSFLPTDPISFPWCFVEQGINLAWPQLILTFLGLNIISSSYSYTGGLFMSQKYLCNNVGRKWDAYMFFWEGGECWCIGVLAGFYA